MSEEKDDNIVKIDIPLFTNLELEEFDFKLDNYLDSIVQEVSKAVIHDKENILLQKVIQKLQKELEQEKEKNKKILGDNIENFRKIFAEEFNKYFISKDKIRAKIEELNKTIYKGEIPEFYAIYRYTADVLEELLEV